MCLVWATTNILWLSASLRTMCNRDKDFQSWYTGPKNFPVAFLLVLVLLCFWFFPLLSFFLLVCFKFQSFFPFASFVSCFFIFFFLLGFGLVFCSIWSFQLAHLFRYIFSYLSCFLMTVCAFFFPPLFLFKVFSCAAFVGMYLYTLYVLCVSSVACTCSVLLQYMWCMWDCTHIQKLVPLVGFWMLLAHFDASRPPPKVIWCDRWISLKVTRSLEKP